LQIIKSNNKTKYQYCNRIFRWTHNLKKIMRVTGREYFVLRAQNNRNKRIEVKAPQRITN